MQVATETQIKCTDLRIGNLVYSERKNIVRIDSVCEWGKRPLFGIPLTPEILEKAGFEMDAAPQVPEWHHKSGFWLYGWNGTELSMRFMNKFDVEIIYLHHLQNFFYGMTGNELEITL